MSGSQSFFKTTAAVACSMSVLVWASQALAQTAPKPPAKPAAKAKARPAKKAAPVVVLPAASVEQIEAAKLVYYGRYECEFKQFIEITESAKDTGYVDVKIAKDAYVMKPVLSSTGALRLEDVKGETLMVQIANKSMLLNVKAGRRLVDDCVSPKQRELIEAAAKAKAEEVAALAAAAAASAASAPADAASASK